MLSAKNLSPCCEQENGFRGMELVKLNLYTLLWDHHKVV